MIKVTNNGEIIHRGRPNSDIVVGEIRSDIRITVDFFPTVFLKKISVLWGGYNGKNNYITSTLLWKSLRFWDVINLIQKISFILCVIIPYSKYILFSSPVHSILEMFWGFFAPRRFKKNLSVPDVSPETQWISHQLLFGVLARSYIHKTLSTTEFAFLRYTFYICSVLPKLFLMWLWFLDF